LTSLVHALALVAQRALFLDYLRRMEDREFQNSPEYHSSQLGKHRFMEKMLKNFDHEKKYTIESMERKTLQLN